jgi:E1A/CREB-binding protein
MYMYVKFVSILVSVAVFNVFSFVYSFCCVVFGSYAWAHIWACPPCEGDDYIFHCHPPEQKIPKPKRLVDWYKKMLDKALSERVIAEYKVSEDT